MTNSLDLDSGRKTTGTLPFAPGDLDASGIRLTRAELARFLDVSRQAVGEWVASGKISFGADGRIDPRQAVSQLMRNTDPARLRSKVLAPLVSSIGGLQRRIAELETKLAATIDDSEFNEGAAAEVIAQQDMLLNHLQNERDELAKYPAVKVVDAVIAWMGDACFSGVPTAGLTLVRCIPTGALFETKEGGGDLV